MLERELLIDAVGADGELISREAAGAGAIAGFRLVQEAHPTTVYVDTSGRTVPEETGSVLVDDDINARVWVHPADPYLPALAPAAFPDAIHTVLARLGVSGSFEPTMLAYRPGKRAVLRLTSSERELFLKVVPPNRAQHIASLHRSLREQTVPVPRVIAWSPAGLLVLEAASGTPGMRAAEAVGAAALLDSVDAVRERLAGAVFEHPARDSIAKRGDWYWSRVPATEAAARLAAIADGRDRVHPEVGVHGDLHLGQLFFGQQGVTGLIDLDTAGTGDAADDSAAFVAHALVSAIFADEHDAPERAAALRTATAEAATRWIRSPHERALAAVHCVAHAGSAFDLGKPERGEAILAAATELLA